MDDEPEMKNLVHRLIAAWNAGDAAGFAGLFVPSAEYTTGRGESIRGRENIAELVRQNSGRSIVSLVDGPSVECNGAAATIRFPWAMEQEGVQVRRGLITCTIVRHQADWLIVSLHNTWSSFFC